MLNKVSISDLSNNVTVKTTSTPWLCALFIRSVAGQPCRLVKSPLAFVSTEKYAIVVSNS